MRYRTLEKCHNKFADILWVEKESIYHREKITKLKFLALAASFKQTGLML